MLLTNSYNSTPLSYDEAMLVDVSRKLCQEGSNCNRHMQTVNIFIAHYYV